VEARYTYKIGPTFAGRVKRLEVQVGDQVKAGQVLGEMEPVDLDDRLRSQESVFKRMRRRPCARQKRGKPTRRPRRAAMSNCLRCARPARKSSPRSGRNCRSPMPPVRRSGRSCRARSDREGLVAQRSNLRLMRRSMAWSPCAMPIPARPSSRARPWWRVIDPKSLWINVRFDQISASGLAGGLPARIVLRSRGGQTLKGRVLRVEPTADAVTEETLAKVTFDNKPEPLPPLGELAEVTVDLPALPAAPVIPNTAVQREGDKVGVWKIVDGDLRFSPVKLGTSDLDGYVQVLEGLKNGDQVVTYSEKALTARSRIHVVDHIPGVSR
jgi:HlyD family secretion protein